MGVLIMLGLAAAAAFALSQKRGSAGPALTPEGQRTSEMVALGDRAMGGDGDAWADIGEVLARTTTADLNRFYDSVAVRMSNSETDAQREYFDRMLSAIRNELNQRSS